MDRQISDQIEGNYIIDMSYADIENEIVFLTEQSGTFWIEPLFSLPKKIDEKPFLEVLAMSSLRRDGRVRRGNGDSKLGYDDFMNRYYN